MDRIAIGRAIQAREIKTAQQRLAELEAADLGTLGAPFDLALKAVLEEKGLRVREAWITKDLALLGFNATAGSGSLVVFVEEGDVDELVDIASHIVVEVQGETGNDDWDLEIYTLSDLDKLAKIRGLGFKVYG